MTMSRRQHSGEFKAKVVLEALRGERTINELAAEYGVHIVLPIKTRAPGTEYTVADNHGGQPCTDGNGTPKPKRSSFSRA